MAERHPAMLKGGAFLLLTLLATTGVARADSGGVDRSFGVDGFAGVNGPCDGLASGMQPDGKILFVCVSGFLPHRITVMRLTHSGTLDTAFGKHGTTELRFPHEAFFENILAEPNGHIVLAGAIRTGDQSDQALYGYRVILVGLTSDGKIDPGFGVGGRVTTNLLFGDPTPSQVGWEFPMAIAMQPDGKIVLGAHSVEEAGAALYVGVGAAGGGAVVQRYTSDGRSDVTFGTGGKALLPLLALYGIGDFVPTAIAPRTDGTILLAGRGTVLGGQGGSSISVFRLLANGVLDPTFGAAGMSTATFPLKWAAPSSVMQQPDGRVVVAGVLGRSAFFLRFGNGIIDPSFGTGGITTANIEPLESVQLAAGPSNMILAATTEGKSGDRLRIYAVIIRLKPNGTFDPGFGRRGFVVDHRMRIARELFAGDRRIVVTGFGPTYGPAALRLLS